MTISRTSSDVPELVRRAMVSVRSKRDEERQMIADILIRDNSGRTS